MCCILFYNESYVASVVLMFLQVVSNNCWSVARVPSYTQYNLNKIITLYLCVLAHQVDLSSIQLGKSITLALVGQSCSTQLNVALILC